MTGKPTKKKAARKSPTSEKATKKRGSGSKVKKASVKKTVKKKAVSVKQAVKKKTKQPKALAKKKAVSKKDNPKGAPAAAGTEAPAGEAVELIVNLATVLAFFGVTRQAVDKWKKKPHWPVAAIVGRDRYDLQKIFVWYKTNSVGKRELTDRQQLADTLKKEADAEIRAVKAAEEMGRVVAISKVNKDVAVIFAFVVSTIEGFVKGLPGKLAGKNEKQMVPILTKEVRQVREYMGANAEKIGEVKQ